MSLLLLPAWPSTGIGSISIGASTASYMRIQNGPNAAPEWQAGEPEVAQQRVDGGLTTRGGMLDGLSAHITQDIQLLSHS